MGDNVNTDMVFAKNAGIGAVLVYSGMTKEGDPKIAGVAPDFTMATFT